MHTPGCTKVSKTDSANSDLSEFDSVIPNGPLSKERKSESHSSQRVQMPTECSICGKAANGYHYDVPSCKGCKTFFRRWCISDKNVVCRTNQDCFDLTKRAEPLNCRSCRYKKCISAGMNPMALKVDEKDANAENYRNLVELTKRVKQSNLEDNEDEEYEREFQIERKQMIMNITSFENKMQKLVDMLSYLEGKIINFRMSSYNPHWNQLPGLEGFLLMESKISLADKYGPMPGWPLKTQSFSPPGPNLRIIQHSAERKEWFLHDLMTSVEYAKTFMFFDQLDMRDRLILIRYVALALMNLHISYFTVKKKYDRIIHPDGSLAPVQKGIVYAETVMSISPLIRCDIQENEYMLLKAICLCNPAVPDLSHHAQEILGREREQYADALFDHCLRNRLNGPCQFTELIGMLELLERQQRMQKDLHLLHIAPFISRIPKEERMLLIEDIMNF